MSDLDTNLPNTAENYDAEEMKDAIEQGELQAPELSVEDDYEAAQKYSEGTLSPKEAEEAVAPQLEVSEAKDVKLTTDSSLSQSSGDTADYRAMAKEVSHSSSGTGPVSDELLAKALEKGEAAQ